MPDPTATAPTPSATPAPPHGFDIPGALAAGLKAGYSGQEVLQHLTSDQPPGEPSSPTFAPLTSAERTDLAAKLSQSLGAGISPEDVVNHVANSDSPYAGRFRASLAMGASAAQITDHLLQTGGGDLEGTPILSPIARGATKALAGVADLASDVGLTGVGSAIRSRLDQQDLEQQSSGAALASDLKQGKLGAALGDLPSAAIEQVPTLVPALAAGALTGGAADAPLLAAALRAGTAGSLNALTTGDAIAKQRAANNGEASPSAGDLVAGLAGGAASGALGSVGLGGVGSGLSGVLKAAALRAGGDAAQPELQSLAGSAGTKAGAQNAAPSDMAASALTGLATRGAMEGPAALGAIHDAMSPTARAASLRATYSAMSPDAQSQLATTAAAGKAMADAQAPGINGTTLSAPDAAKVAQARLAGSLGGLVGTLKEDGTLDDSGVATIKDATAAALSPRDNLTSDHLANIDALGLDPASHSSVTGALRTIDRLSGSTAPAAGPIARMLPEAAGPIARMLPEAAGPIAGSVVGAALGGGEGGVIGGLAGAAARQTIAPVLSRIGGALDRGFGLVKPSLALQAARAASLLDAAGLAVPDTNAGLQAAMAGTRDSMATQARLLGLPVAANDGTTNSAPAPDSTTASTTPAATAFDGPLKATQEADAAAAQQRTAPGLTTAVKSGGVLSGLGDATPPGASMTSPNFPAAPGARPGDLDPTNGAGLSGDAALLAARLPAWQYGLGTALEQALHVSGQPRAVNHAAEVGSALDDLVADGALTPAMATALRGHQGRVVPLVYGLIRQRMLLSNGLDRRTAAAQTAGVGSTSSEAPTAAATWPVAAE